MRADHQRLLDVRSLRWPRNERAEAGAAEFNSLIRFIQIVDHLIRRDHQREVLAAAEAKLRLGVARERVLAELGYGASDPGVT